ncbi:hypothetical protein [Roseibium aggregatum]|uniref:hypothetical protein n=1 Tax=Roseibium aggregatum TaxID=187304 RepID=UPI001E442234|nr:hypothetical protein [Roseibium aggregatum]UES42196.1 hypothetical protein GFC08_29795 [Roseibium aggregatum]UES42261.1 hypothetical protein GFC08_30165 [Roseibium aggregatum]
MQCGTPVCGLASAFIPAQHNRNDNDESGVRIKRDAVYRREQDPPVARRDEEGGSQVAAAARAEIDARELADKTRIERVLQDEAARKAERDRRYANRKARQG